jgi:RNA polymerase sigma factor (sigma-70 family)
MGTREAARAAGSPVSSPSARAAALPPFEVVVERFGPAVLRFCAARAGSGRADDVFQETMIAAMRGYDSVRDPASIRAWLFTIAARKALDARRAEARAPEPVESVDAAGADGEPPLLRDEAWAPVRELPEKQRQAVTLRFLADLTHREIAAVMETSEAAARRNLHEGLRRLREERG